MAPEHSPPRPLAILDKMIPALAMIGIFLLPLGFRVSQETKGSVSVQRTEPLFPTCVECLRINDDVSLQLHRGPKMTENTLLTASHYNL